MKRTKSFDAVGFMRTVRGRMSREMIGMTPQQQIQYIERRSGLKRPRKRAEERPGRSPMKRGRTRRSAAMV